MTKTTQQNIELLKALLEINDWIVDTSTLMSIEAKGIRMEASKESMASLTKYHNEYVDYLNSTSIKELIEMFLGFWNEFTSFDTERFWEEVGKRQLKVTRKRSLQTILNRGRFLDFHEVMSARDQWDALINSTYVQNHLAESERNKLIKIMNDDEMSRVTLFNKCIKTNRLPNSSALKYWDSMAYFSEYNLYEKHFTQSEIYIIKLIREKSDEAFHESHKNKIDPTNG